MDMACTAFCTAPFIYMNTWNELISGYIINGFSEEGIKVFNNLRELGFEADVYTYSNTLEACCRFANQVIGRQLHCDLLKSGFHSHDYVCSSLIKFYSTFGLLDDCYKFFNEPEKIDLVSRETMISSLAHQGFNHEAMKFLQLLMKSGEIPDDFILVNILNSCASIAAYRQVKSFHALVIKLGCCLYPFVASALIDAYAKCSDRDIVRVAFKQSFKLHDAVMYNAMIMAYSESNAGYVLLGKVYSESGSWEDGASLTKKMVERGVAKGPGYSWIET